MNKQSQTILFCNTRLLVRSTTFTLHVFASPFWWLFVKSWPGDLCRSQGRIGDGSDVPRASHSQPLCFFSLLLFSRRYVSRPSTRPLTLLTLPPDGITIPGLLHDVATISDLGAERSTGRFLSSVTRFDTRVVALSPWSCPSWRGSLLPQAPIEMQSPRNL
jgi:hypothetical protein